ncbi:Ribosomal protein L37, mitochondrial [Dillenia turbinata]|uniref:Large ribosomal subunit protein mL54 n=1 Tax=Dillenia turbinata TaxID=194707 RepID=A0AAN8VJA3_9MAGN
MVFIRCYCLGTLGGMEKNLRFLLKVLKILSNLPKDTLHHQVMKDIKICMDKEMAFSCIRPLGNLANTRGAIEILGCRTFAVGGGKAKKGSKTGAAGDVPKASTLGKEVKSTPFVGANILKDGADPKVLADSEYPDWL